MRNARQSACIRNGGIFASKFFVILIFGNSVFPLLETTIRFENIFTITCLAICYFHALTLCQTLLWLPLSMRYCAHPYLHHLFLAFSWWKYFSIRVLISEWWWCWICGNLKINFSQNLLINVRLLWIIFFPLIKQSVLIVYDQHIAFNNYAQNKQWIRFLALDIIKSGCWRKRRNKFMKYIFIYKGMLYYFTLPAPTLII